MTASDAHVMGFRSAWTQSRLRTAPVDAPLATELFATVLSGWDLLLHAEASDLADTERALGMLSTRMASARFRMADAISVVAAARHVLGEAPPAMPHYWEWVTSVLADAALAAAAAAAREPLLDVIATASPVVYVTETTPALLLVANPDSVAIEAACARLLLAIVRRGASHAIVDATWCQGSPSALARHVSNLAAHAQLRHTELIVVVADREALAVSGGNVAYVACFADALRRVR
ncbi:MAG: hypothetical protein IPL79_18085 [Myxococcales bacterium]|nr:hypothetical protein [Myxococcales bacterium]